MKLIDKEALLLALRKKRYSKQSLDLIENQPVVDAIPVEWIRDYISHWVSEAYKNFVLHMIKNWEKENEGCIRN